MRTATRIHLPVKVIDIEIPAGSSLSGPIDLGNAGEILSRIAIPSDWTGTNLSYQVSYNGLNYSDYYQDDGTEITSTVAGGREVALDLNNWLNVRYLKIRSGVSASPVDQQQNCILHCTIG